MNAVLRRENDLVGLELALAGGDAVRYYWRNAGEQRGVFFARQELRMLLHHIGSSPEWDWIVCSSDLPGDRWTQAGGHAESGLIVEINGPHRVVRRNATRSPRHNIGTSSWTYVASTDELHDLDAALGIQHAWLTHGAIRSSLELREPDLGVRRHW